MIGEVIPGLLFIGDGASALDASELRARGIRKVINAASADVPCPFEASSGTDDDDEDDDFSVEYLRLPLDDDPDEPLLFYVFAIVDFVGRAEADGCGCLVHCEQGRSRAAAVVLAYLVRGCGMPLKDALDAVLDAKPDVLPNRGFLAQLQVLERRVLGTVSLLAYPGQ